MQKKQIIHTIALIWIILSAAFIIYDTWTDFQTTKLDQAYKSGKYEILNGLVQQAGQGCNPISVSDGQGQVQVVNYNCLPAEK